MKLYDSSTDTEFEVMFAPPTAARRARLSRINEQATVEMRQVVARHPKCYEIELTEPEGCTEPIPSYSAPPEYLLNGEDRLKWVQAEQLWRAAEERLRNEKRSVARQRSISDPDNFDMNYQQYQADAQEVTDRTLIRTFQCGLSTRGLADAYRALVESDADSEFWQNQDYGVVVEGAARFLNSCSTGRRADSVHPDVGSVPPAAVAVEGSAGESRGATS